MVAWFVIILHLNTLIWIYRLYIIYFIFIDIYEAKVTSWLDIELDLVPYIDVLLIWEIGVCCEHHNTYLIYW